MKFWDALDYIGVLAYFPLTKTVNPSEAEIAAAWEKRCAELARYSKAHDGKQFLFVEIGYNESARAAAEPWAFKTGGEQRGAKSRQRCIEVALRSAAADTRSSPECIGGNGFRRCPSHEEENYRLQTPAIKALIAKHWKEALQQRCRSAHATAALHFASPNFFSSSPSEI